jgi:hypothetical protein
MNEDHVGKARGREKGSREKGNIYLRASEPPHPDHVRPPLTRTYGPSVLDLVSRRSDGRLRIQSDHRSGFLPLQIWPANRSACRTQHAETAAHRKQSGQCGIELIDRD